MRLLVSLAAALLLAGCATAPGTHSFNKTRTYNKSYDQVWSNLMDLLTAKGVQIKTVEKDSGIVYFEGAGFRDDQGDCGKPGMNVPAGRQVNVNVYVRRVGDEQTSATVNTNFVEARRFGNQPAVTVTCNSTGQIENAILSEL